MRKINKNQKLICLFVVIIICICINVIYLFSSGQIKINSIFNNIDNLNIEQERKNITKVLNSIERKSVLQKTLIKSKIIDAYLKYNEQEYEHSITKLDEVLLEIEDKNNYDEILYKVYKVEFLNYIALNNARKAEEKFNQMIKLDNYHNNSIETIDLITKNIPNLLNIEDGTDVATSMIDTLMVDFSQIEDYKKKIELCRTHANIYAMEGQFNISLESQIKAFNIATKNSDEEKACEILIDMSTSYTLLESYDESIKIIKYCMENYKLDTNTKVNLLSYLSVAYIEKKQYYMCEKTLLELEKEMKNLDNGLEIANEIWLYVAFSNLYTQNGDYEKSEKYLKETEFLYNKYKDSKNQLFLGTDVSILAEYGDLYYAKAEYQKALDNHLQAYNILSSRGSGKDMIQLLESISDDYMKLGEIEKRDEILDEIKKIYDKESIEDNKREIKNVYTKIILEEKNEKIKIIEQYKLISNVIIIILIISTIVFYISNVKTLDKKNKIKKINEKLINENIKDPLTEIYNRRGLEDYFKKIDFENDFRENYAFFMIDIDCFKLYNDNYGHLQGDYILKEISNALQNLNEDAFVCRYGGEEFILILNYTDETEIYHLAYKMYRTIELMNIEHKYSKVSNRLTISTGICYGQFKKGQGYEIINQADNALYKSKESGRNRYTISKIKPI